MIIQLESATLVASLLHLSEVSKVRSAICGGD